MNLDPASGTEGYAEEAEILIKRWQSLSFAENHKHTRHLIPHIPSKILDIGAGIGLDAAALAAMGHQILAVEPVDALRQSGMELYPSPRVEWLNDSLPALATVKARKESFDLLMLSAVWMHLDESERQQAMPCIASLIRAGGTMIISLRHGPVPLGRRMFEVTAEETVGIAHLQGLHPILNVKTGSIQQSNKAAGVTWTHLAFAKSV